MKHLKIQKITWSNKSNIIVAAFSSHNNITENQDVNRFNVGHEEEELLQLKFSTFKMPMIRRLIKASNEFERGKKYPEFPF